MKKVYITGISGTGKTSIANILNEKGITSYSIDEVSGLCFWVNNQDGTRVDYEATLDAAFIASHKWMCDIEKLKDILNTPETVAVLGHVENEKDFLSLFDTVILLQCKPETFISRILQRTDNDFGKDITAQKFLLDTYQKFEDDMLKRGATPLSTDKPLEEVVKNIIALI